MNGKVPCKLLLMVSLQLQTSANIGIPAAVASLDAPVASAIGYWLCYRCLWCFLGPVFGISCDDGSSSSGVLRLSAFSDILSCAAIKTAALAFLTTIGFPRSSLWLESLLFLPSLLLLVVPTFLASLLSDYDYRTCFSAIAIRLSIIRTRNQLSDYRLSEPVQIYWCPSLNVVGVITSSPKTVQKHA